MIRGGVAGEFSLSFPLSVSLSVTYVTYVLFLVCVCLMSGLSLLVSFPLSVSLSVSYVTYVVFGVCVFDERAKFTCFLPSLCLSLCDICNICSFWCVCVCVCLMSGLSLLDSAHV